MGLFNFGKKNNYTNSNNEGERWDNFCRLDESFKNDAKLKPIYYLKLYCKNMINTNSEINKKELRDYILNVYNTMINEKFENYKFNGNTSNIYFYGYKLIVIFNEDEENLNFGVKESNIVHMQKVKRLLNISDELFTANYKDIIWNDKVPKHIENKFYTGKPYYTFKHEKYGDIEFYYIEDEIEIKCKALDPEKFEIVGVEDTVENEAITLLYIKAIEKTIEIKEKVMETLYSYTLEICKSWDEKDENGNEISRDYIENHFSRIRISIWPQALNKEEGYSEENTTITFAGDLYGEDGEYGVGLLGGHEIVASTVNGDDIGCSLNG